MFRRKTQHLDKRADRAVRKPRRLRPRENRHQFLLQLLTVAAVFPERVQKLLPPVARQRLLQTHPPRLHHSEKTVPRLAVLRALRLLRNQTRLRYGHEFPLVLRFRNRLFRNPHAPSHIRIALIERPRILRIDSELTRVHLLIKLPRLFRRTLFHWNLRRRIHHRIVVVLQLRKIPVALNLIRYPDHLVTVRHHRRGNHDCRRLFPALHNALTVHVQNLNPRHLIAQRLRPLQRVAPELFHRLRYPAAQWNPVTKRTHKHSPFHRIAAHVVRKPLNNPVLPFLWNQLRQRPVNRKHLSAPFRNTFRIVPQNRAPDQSEQLVNLRFRNICLHTVPVQRVNRSAFPLVQRLRRILRKHQRRPPQFPRQHILRRAPQSLPAFRRSQRLHKAPEPVDSLLLHRKLDRVLQPQPDPVFRNRRHSARKPELNHVGNAHRNRVRHIPRHRQTPDRFRLLRKICQQFQLILNRAVPVNLRQLLRTLCKTEQTAPVFRNVTPPEHVQRLRVVHGFHSALPERRKLDVRKVNPALA